MDPEHIQRKNQLPRVAVIGAGIGGLQSVRHLKDVSQVICFESSNQIGGLWNYHDKTEMDLQNTEKDLSFKQYGYTNSSLFDGAQSNIPKCLMTFKGFPMNKKYPQFLNQQQFLRYIEKYARKHHLKQYIKFQHLVQQIRVYKNLTQDELSQINKHKALNEFKNSKFVIIISQNNKNNFVYYADYIISCNGMYRVPFYPDIPQLREWDGKVTHSHSFRQRDLKDYKDKQIAIYGYGFSAVMLIQFILKNSNAKKLTIIGPPIIQTLLDSTDFAKDVENNRLQISIGSILRLEKNKQIILEENEVLDKVDHLILATGYLYSFPFFDKKDQIIQSYQNQNFCQGPLYLKMISINHPEVIFIGLLQKIISIQNMYEKQAIIAKLIVNNQIKLPSSDQMHKDWLQDISIARSIRPDLKNYFHVSSMEDSERFYIEKLASNFNLDIDEDHLELSEKIKKKIIQKLVHGDFTQIRNLDFSYLVGDKYSPSLSKF